MQKSQRKVFVVSAPSGTGKTTLNRRLIDEHPDIGIAVSYTTRAKRPGENDGEHYHFVSQEQFRLLIKNGEMLEYAEVFGTLYGTAFSELDRIAGLGQTAVLEIDVQGWRQAKLKLANARAVFILPPSIETLWERLSSRGTESLEKRRHRLMTAQNEISAWKIYDYFIVNGEIDSAYRDLVDIVVRGQSGRLDRASGEGLCQRLLEEFSSPWFNQVLGQDGVKKSI